jgi:hypothetical protein
MTIVIIYLLKSLFKKGQITKDGLSEVKLITRKLAPVPYNHYINGADKCPVRTTPDRANEQN